MLAPKLALRNLAMLDVAQDCSTISRWATGSSAKGATKGKRPTRAEKPHRRKVPMRHVSRVRTL